VARRIIKKKKRERGEKEEKKAGQPSEEHRDQIAEMSAIAAKEKYIKKSVRGPPGNSSRNRIERYNHISKGRRSPFMHGGGRGKGGPSELRVGEKGWGLGIVQIKDRENRPRGGPRPGGEKTYESDRKMKSSPPRRSREKGETRDAQNGLGNRVGKKRFREGALGKGTPEGFGKARENTRRLQLPQGGIVDHLGCDILLPRGENQGEEKGSRGGPSTGKEGQMRENRGLARALRKMFKNHALPRDRAFSLRGEIIWGPRVLEHGGETARALPVMDVGGSTFLILLKIRYRLHGRADRS